MPIVLDESRFPLVKLELSNPFTDDDLNDVVKAVARLGHRSLKEKAPYAIAISADVVLGAERRRRLAELYGAIPEEVRNAGLQSFAYLHTALVRGALRALQWSVPGLMGETVLVDSFEEAIKRAETELAQTKRFEATSQVATLPPAPMPRMLARPS